MYYDTALSANPYALSSLTRLVGADHILFASDFPFAPELVTEMTVTGLKDFPFDETQRQQMDRGTALDLLPSVANRLHAEGAT